MGGLKVWTQAFSPVQASRCYERHIHRIDELDCTGKRLKNAVRSVPRDKSHPAKLPVRSVVRSRASSLIVSTVSSDSSP